MRIQGTATELSLGQDGSVFALDGEGKVWLRPPGDEKTPWMHLPGNFARVAAQTQHRAFAIDKAGALFRYDGTWWQLVDGFPLKDVNVCADGTIIAISKSGALVSLIQQQPITALKESPQGLSRVACQSPTDIWVTRDDQSVFHFDRGMWQQHSIYLVEVATGNGQTIGRTADDRLVRLEPGKARWKHIAAIVRSVAVSPDGKPWVTTADGRIYANDPNTGNIVRRSGNKRESVFSRIYNWKLVPGEARTLTISSAGVVAATGRNGEVWLWKGKGNWMLLPGKLKRIAAEPSGRLWGIDDDGNIQQYNGTLWRRMPGRANDIAIGGNGDVWIRQPDGALAAWDFASNQWKSGEPGKKAAGIAVDPEGQPWIVGEDGKILRHDAKGWREVPGIEATSVAIGPEGSVYAVDTEETLWLLDRLRKEWDRVNGQVAGVAVGPSGKPWVVSPKSEIYASSFFEEKKPEVQTGLPAGSAPSLRFARVPVVPTSKDPLLSNSFTHIQGFAGRSLAIGNDGSVFALSFDGALSRWSNARNRFSSFPGVFSRIAVAPDGKPWGVTGRGEVWRHDGTTWRIVRGVAAQEINVGLNGTVIVAGNDETLYRYLVQEDRFERLRSSLDGDSAPTGSRVAIDPQGHLWTITKDHVILRCDTQPCERLAQPAREIGIGPEGSIFIVDADNQLRRLNKSSGEWERIGIDATTVAVGPGGKPWIANAKAEVWASGFFPRDESGDLALAAATTTATATAGSGITTTPVFTFSVNMPFDAVPLPVGFTGGGDINLAFTPDGRLVVIDVAFAFWNYDENPRRFTLDNTVPTLAPLLGAADTRSFLIAKDGAYWVSNNSFVSPMAWRRAPGGQWIKVHGLDDCAVTPGCGLPSPISITSATDGSIYATSTGDNIMRYDTTQQKFVRVAIPPPNASGSIFLTIDTNGRFWAASPFPALLYEYVGNKWVQRTDAIIGAPGVCLFTKVPCVSLSTSGTAYGYGAAFQPVRWNSTSNVWEKITSSPLMPANSTYAAAPDGRLWVWTGTTLHRSR